MKKINDLVFHYLLNNAIKIFGVALLFVILLQIFGRSFMSTPPSWTEEMSRFLFVWYSFLACVVTLREKQHLGLDYFYRKFSRTIARIIDYSTQALILFFGVYTTYYGYQLLGIVAKRKAPITKWNMTWFYLVLPLMGVLFVLVALENIQALVKASSEKKEVSGK